MKPKHHKTKIVCTIGPSCQSENILGRMMRAGMTIARLNFAHGNLAQHGHDIHRIREVARRLGRPCDVLIDLPGPKIRLGKLKKEPLHLKKGHSVRLTTQETPGTAQRLYVNYPKLPQSVRKGGLIYLNDGFLQLEVLKIEKTEVYCKVLIGGPLLSFKGLNLPKAKLFVEPVTENDLRFLDFGLAHGVDLFGVSFIEKAGDILKVKAHARGNGRKIRTVAKIERAEALRNLGGILKVTDMVMVARGDLGVQIPIEDVPLAQKGIIHAGLKRGVPVITATQMLESMVHNVRPTRAEVTDVANAILDGTSAVMLSEETAIGEYPVETVEMMARIAHKAESAWKSHPLKNF
jgi:pyruvate kinase